MKNQLLNILVVEDDLTTAQFLREVLLLGLPSAKLDIAFDGIEGLSRAKDAVYDIILTDIRMPRMNGLDMLRHLRELHVYADIPKIAFSGNAARKEFMEAHRLGACYCLRKPFDCDELIATVKDALDLYSEAL